MTALSHAGCIAAAMKNKAKTHCLRDHEYTPENTRMSNGTRKCRTCENRYNLLRKNSGNRKVGIRVSGVSNPRSMDMKVPQECKKCEITGPQNFFHDTTRGMESFRCRQCGTEHYAYDAPPKSSNSGSKYSS